MKPVIGKPATQKDISNARRRAWFAAREPWLMLGLLLFTAVPGITLGTVSSDTFASESDQDFLVIWMLVGFALLATVWLISNLIEFQLNRFLQRSHIRGVGCLDTLQERIEDAIKPLSSGGSKALQELAQRDEDVREFVAAIFKKEQRIPVSMDLEQAQRYVSRLTTWKSEDAHARMTEKSKQDAYSALASSVGVSSQSKA